MYWKNNTYRSTWRRQTETKLCTGMLVDAVSDVARNVFEQLGSGLPRSVYQLILCRRLAELGVVLESEHLLHGLFDTENDIIVLDRSVSIVCLAGANSRQTIQRCQLAVSNSECDMALVIDFSDQVSLYPVCVGKMVAVRH